MWATLSKLLKPCFDVNFCNGLAWPSLSPPPSACRGCCHRRPPSLPLAPFRTQFRVGLLRKNCTASTTTTSQPQIFFCSVAAVSRVPRILELEAKQMMRRNCVGLLYQMISFLIKWQSLEVGIKKKMFTKPSLNIQSFQNLFPLFSRDFIEINFVKFYNVKSLKISSNIGTHSRLSAVVASSRPGNPVFLAQSSQICSAMCCF